MKKWNRHLALLMTFVMVFGLFGVLPKQAEAATTVYSENFDSYSHGSAPISQDKATVSIVENASKKLYTKVEKEGTDGVLHVYGEAGGQSGGPRMGVQIDASKMTSMTITFQAKADGHPACVNLAAGSKSKQIVSMGIEEWTPVTCVVDFTTLTYSMYFSGESKMYQSLEFFDETTDFSGTQIRFSGATVQPGQGAYFDDIVVTATYEGEEPVPPYIPVQTPEKASVPTGAYAFVDTDFSDVFCGDMSRSEIFATETENIDVVAIGTNRLMRFWPTEGAAVTPYTTFKLPTSANNYVLDTMVMLNDGASLNLGVYAGTSSAGAASAITTNTTGYVKDVWNRVQLSVNLSTKQMTLVLNGTTVSTTTLSYSSSNRSKLTLRIGASVDALKVVYADNLSFYTTDSFTAILNGANNGIAYQNVKPQNALGENSFVYNLKDHPRLFVRDWDAMRQRVTENEMTQMWYANIKASADSALTSKMTTYSVNNRGNILESARKARDRLLTLAFTYGVTQDEKYLNRAYEEMLEYGTWSDWSGFNSSLVTAEIMMGYAYAYDWLYDGLTQGQKQEISEIVKKHALPDFIHNYEGVRTSTNFTTSTINWNPVCNASAIAWALASADEENLIAEYLLEKAPPCIPYALGPYAPEGAYPEGVSYWDYGTSYLIFANDFLENAFVEGFELPDNYKYGDAPGMEATPDFGIYFDGPTGRFNYGDCSKGHTSSEVMYWAANRYDKPYYAWWQDNRQKDTGSYFGSYSAVASLAWYDPDNAYYVEGAFPLDKFYTAPGEFNGAAMRSSWEDATALYTAVQGGNNAENHQHLSLGTYVVDYMGKRFVRVLNYYSYAISGTKADIYYKRAESYNTLVVNPSAAADQKTNASAGIVDSYSSDRMAYSVLDLSNTSDDLVSYNRGVMLADNRSRVIVQDEAVATEPSEFYWFANSDADIAIAADGKSAVLTMDGDKMLARIVEGPAQAKFEVMERKSLISGVNNTISTDAGQKLFIHLENMTTLNLAVEYVPLKGSTTPRTWAYKPLAEWESYDDIEVATATTRSETADKYVFSTTYKNVPENAYLVVALYDENDRMVATKMQTISGFGEATSVLDKKAYAYAKVMLLESFFSMRILAEPEIL